MTVWVAHPKASCKRPSGPRPVGTPPRDPCGSAGTLAAPGAPPPPVTSRATGRWDRFSGRSVPGTREQGPLHAAPLHGTGAGARDPVGEGDGPCRDRTCDLGIESSRGRSRGISCRLGKAAARGGFRNWGRSRVSAPLRVSFPPCSHVAMSSAPPGVRSGLRSDAARDPGAGHRSGTEAGAAGRPYRGGFPAVLHCSGCRRACAARRCATASARRAGPPRGWRG